MMTLLLALMAAFAAGPEGAESTSTVAISGVPSDGSWVFVSVANGIDVFSRCMQRRSCLQTESVKVIAGNSKRFGRSCEESELPVPDALQLEADGRTLFLTNFNSNSLQTIDLERLPLKPK
jgi:hypothetical protein